MKKFGYNEKGEWSPTKQEIDIAVAALSKQFAASSPKKSKAKKMEKKNVRKRRT